VQIRWEDGQWRDATVECTLEGGGIRVRFDLDGYEYHWLPEVWRVTAAAGGTAEALLEESSSDEPQAPPGAAAAGGTPAGGTAEAPPAAAPQDGEAQPPATVEVQAEAELATLSTLASDDEAESFRLFEKAKEDGVWFNATVEATKDFGIFTSVRPPGSSPDSPAYGGLVHISEIGGFV